MQRITREVISVIVSLLLVFTPTLSASGIEVDGTTNTTLENAQNGVQVVNIANPNAQGLSHNKYTHYNVSKDGLILNNSMDTSVKTQLGGYIYGNSHLTSNAKVILNEVTSTNPSQLNGYTEVAGKRADLVIANPNGIRVNGAGFINTSNVTLTTGRPNIVNGVIDSYDVAAGEIAIEGAGLDTTQTDGAYLYASVLRLNAKIYANGLDAKFASLDSSALGGMYANAITLEGTSQGVGVTLPPEVIASNGDIAISNDGTIVVNKLSASKDIVVSSSDDIEVNHQISSANNIDLEATNITNNSLINAANTLTVKSQDFVNNQTVFSGNESNFYITNRFLNNDNANIFTINNLLIAKNEAHEKTNTITNQSATIETINGDIELFANTLNNSTDEPVIQTQYTQNGNTQTWTDYIESQGVSAKLLSGKNLYINANNVVNKYSLISAGININIEANTFENNSIDLWKKTKVKKYKRVAYEDCHKIHLDGWGCSTKHKNVAYYEYSNAVIDTVASTLQSGGDITSSTDNLLNGNVNKNQMITSATYVNQQTGEVSYINSGNAAVIITIPTSDDSLFVKASPESDYLIETNPEFAIYENFISSDYMMSHIKYDAEITSKRLGDALYENNLVRESIFKQTGQRFLTNDLTNDNEQFKYLMDNAIQVSQDLELTPGIALSKEQINALVKDIVWMQEQEVEGEKVLVPVVYIANAKDFRLQGARIVAANDIEINSANVLNMGTVSAGNNLTISTTDSINNYGGTIEAIQDMSLEATNDITNTSGTIVANNVNLTSIDGSIVNERFMQGVDALSIETLSGNINKSLAQAIVNQRTNTVDYKTLVGGVANIEATNDLNIDAKKSVKVVGSELNAEAMSIAAQDVEITTAVDRRNFSTGGKSNYLKEKATTHLASNINAENITINAVDTSIIKGSNIYATNTLDITADSIDISAVNNSTYKEEKSSSEGLLKSSSTTTKKATSTNIASNLSGANINLTTTQDDINIIGSNVSATETLVLQSAANIDVEAGYDGTMDETYTKKSGFFTGGALYSKSEDLEGRLTKTAQNSNLSGKNITMNANNDIVMEGVDLHADENINATAVNIELKNSTNTEQTYSKHTKITVGVGDVAMTLLAPVTNLDYEGGKVSYTLAEGTYDKDTKTETKTTVNSSNVDATNINFNASSSDTQEGNILIQGSNLEATEDINLQATNNITIKEAKESTTSNTTSAHGEVNFNVILKNEFVQIGYAVDDAAKAAEALKKAKESYSQYKNNLASQQTKLSQLKADFANAKVGIEQADIDEMQTYLNELKNDEAYYAANIALATTTLATKLTAVAAQGSKASSTTATFGFNAGAELDIDAIEQQLQEYKEKSIASNLKANNINIQANNTATIQGSNLQANNEINIDAKDINIQASRDVATSKTSTNHQNITLGYEVYGGVTTSTSADTSHQTSSQLQHTNSQLQANTININTTEDTTIQGANLHANQQLNINTNNLEVSSVQNTTSSKSNSKSFNLSTSGFTPTGAGGSLSKSSSSSAQTLLTSLSAEEVNINVEEATTLKGATLAAVDEEGNDNSQLNLQTNTLNISSLNNTSNSKSISAGANIGGSFADNNLNNVGIEFSNDTSHSKTKTLATLGEGNIQITDQENSNTQMLNRDIANNEIDIYDIESHKGLQGQLDTRLLTQEGREEIAQQINDIQEMTGDFIAKTQDYLHETTLTQEIRETIKQEGVKEYFVKSLQEKGVDEQTINTLLEDRDIASLFGLNQASKDNPQQISQSHNEILLDAILVTPELSFAETLTNTMQSGARGIDTLVQAVGEDNAAMALMAIQVAVEGAPKTILSTIGDNALNTVREPTTDAMSSFINEKAFETQFLQNPDEQEAYAYLSDQLAELGFDFIFAGSYSIMRSSKKVTSADAKVDEAGKVDFYVKSNGDAIPSTGYRAVSGKGIEAAKNGDLMAPNDNPTYFTFDNPSGKSATQIQSELQLPTTPTHYGEFDTLQIIDDVKIPNGMWNKADYPEPITKDFGPNNPNGDNYGKGGATQAITDTKIENYELKEINP